MIEIKFISNNKILALTTRLGKKIFPLTTTILIASFGIWSLNEFSIKSQNKSEIKALCNDEREFSCKLLPFSPLIGLISSSIITSVITILVLEIALKEESLKSIREIFKLSDASKYIAKVHIDTDDQIQIIRKALKELKGGETIRMLCSSEMIDILHERGLGPGILFDKLALDCKFQILTLHPNSNISPIVVKRDVNATKDKISRKLSLFRDLMDLIRQSSANIPGSIIIKTYENSHSPFSYFSIDSKYPSDNINLISIACLNDADLIYPSIELSGRELIDKANKHFDSFV